VGAAPRHSGARLAAAGIEDLEAGEVLLPGINRKYIVAGVG
jgi:hypothetical protein